MSLPSNIEGKANTKIGYVKDDIKLSKTQLHEYATNEFKFERKIKELNALGAHYINQDQENQALFYLLQAEKILQYVASCGRTIQRTLIIATLQNQAYAYQKLEDLQKSSDYMEAIISNTQSTLDYISPSKIAQAVKDEHSQMYTDFTIFITRRIEAIIFYLQYSAIKSQINHHNLSFESAKSALKLLEGVCLDCLKYQKIKKGKNSILMQDLIGLFDFKEQSFKTMLQQTKKALKQIKKHRYFFSFDIHLIQNFMIGDIMQMNTATVQQKSKSSKLQDQITHLSIIYKALYLSICYFVMGTQLRLISNKKSSNEADYHKSKLYHLYGIKIVANLIPCESKYLEHLIKSFKNHYKIDITSDTYFEENETLEMLNSKSHFKSHQIEENTKINAFEVQVHGRYLKTPSSAKRNSIIVFSKGNSKNMRSGKSKKSPYDNPEDKYRYGFFKNRGKKKNVQKSSQITQKFQANKNSPTKTASKPSSKEHLKSPSGKKTRIEKTNKQYLVNDHKKTKKKKKEDKRSKSKSKPKESEIDVMRRLGFDKGKIGVDKL